MPGFGVLNDRLDGKLLHITHPKRVVSIMKAGAIQVEPKNISDKERWIFISGYPFVRRIGGVSLFDFHNIDVADHEAILCRFVPYPKRYKIPPILRLNDNNDNKRWGGGVWFEIDREAIAKQFISGSELLKKRRKVLAGTNGLPNIMPHIEAAHIGDLPISAISSAFLTWEDGNKVKDFDVKKFDRAYYGKILDEWKSSPEDEMSR